MEGYHGTNSDIADKILASGFELKTNPNNLPNDLGNGIYIFLDNDLYTKSAYEMAKSFIEVFRKEVFRKRDLNDKFSVLQIQISEEGRYIDYNDINSQIAFEKFRNENYDKILKHYDSFCYKSNYGGSTKNLPGKLKRANLDGIIFELLKNKANIDGVMKDTYTPQDAKYKKSSFFNGREFCLYNTSLIEEISIIEN
ncbi:hypothetical protein ACO4C2_02955 [Streptococcus equinus]|uniref:hypothetical protein n=1 Tax=Streptococcus TaxID=1301 RepID=UPI0010562681|nr:hypothetical protein [Streptococcus sp. KCJ4932]TDE68277.1 hypothetical protein E0E02_04030 [Streptococcus sp. KCJ4932]